jgi:hypothetical protein
VFCNPSLCQLAVPHQGIASSFDGRLFSDISCVKAASHQKAVFPERGPEPPLLAMCGRLPVGKGFFDGDAELVGAVLFWLGLPD